MNDKYILTIDQSTSGTKCLLIDSLGHIKFKAAKSHNQIYPHPSWVEHNPMEIYENVKQLVHEMFLTSGVSEENVIGLSITNQRETVVVWDKNTGKPIYNAIVWQCRRTTEICNSLKMYENVVTEKTGLKLDPYFSGTKVKWILENIEGAKEKALNGDLLMGTMDSWLIYKLTQGKVHATDYTNASRTLLLNIKDLKWDKELLDIFEVPESMMPEIKASDDMFGETDFDGILHKKLKITGVIGDSQGALFGQCCFEKGMCKATFGTGNSIIVNIGDKYIASKNGVVTTIASVSKKMGVSYGIEGIVNSSGDTINWIENELGLFDDFSEFNEAVTEIKDNCDVYLVPAFIGLGVPHWNPDARASIIGMSRNTTKKHVMRAALESIAYQVKDALLSIENDAGIKVESLNIDGGVTVNPVFNQFLADLLNCSIEKNMEAELSAMGAAYLGGLSLGVWNSREELMNIERNKQHYKAEISKEDRDVLYKGWTDAVKSVLYLTELKKN